MTVPAGTARERRTNTRGMKASQIALKAKPEYLRLALAALVLLIALRMLYGLGVQPDEIYTVVPL